MAQFYADRISLGSHRAKTPEGFLVCLGVPFARTGIQEYKESEIMHGGGGKIIKVLRTAEEVFDPATLASFEGKSITYTHPPQFINPDNWQNFAKGHAQNIRRGLKLADGEECLVGDLIITDSSLIPKVENNLVTELSAGYACEYEPDPHTDGLYRQRTIRGNHIAVVPAGRAGGSIKILDSKEELAVEPVAVTDDRVSVGALTGLLRLLGIGKATDAESEPVKKNEEVHEEALERAKTRNEDKKPEEEKMAEKGKEEQEESFKKATDSLSTAATALTKLAETLDKKLSKDEDEEKEEKKKPFQKKEEEDEDEKEEEKKEKHEEEDSDLVAVETMGKEDRPKNPIPGADKALDALRAMKPFIAKSNDKALKQQFNDAILAIKSGGTVDYAGLLKTSKPNEVENGERKTTVLSMPARDAKVGEDFVTQASKFHRRNVGEAAAERRTAGKE
jgi:hypothetical protein